MNNCIMIAIGVILGVIMQTKGIIATTWQWWGIVGCLSIVYVIGYSMGKTENGTTHGRSLRLWKRRIKRN